MNNRPINIAVAGGAFLAGIILFVWMLILSDAVPTEYRNTSPGYGWTWDFDWETALREAGRLGEEPWPWPAKKTGNRIVLPLNQPLVSEGFEITYRGVRESGDLQLAVVIHNLDASVSYPREYGELEAKRGFMIADHHFMLEKFTPVYILLRSTTLR